MHEIDELQRARPFEHVAFMDANFFVFPRRARDFSRRLWEYDPRLTWAGTATVDHVVRHRGEIAEIARNCVMLELGLESGSDSVLARFGKRTTVAHNLEALKILRAAGIEVDVDFIMYDPWTTLEELRENLEFLARADLLGYHPSDLLYNPLKLYPGTATYESFVSGGILKADPFGELLAPFEDRRTLLVFKAMRSFRASYQQEIDRFFGWLNRVEGLLLLPPPLQQAARVLEVRLRHAPYRVFAAVVGVAGTDPTAAEIELSALSEVRRLERLASEARLCVAATAEDQHTGAECATN